MFAGPVDAIRVWCVLAINALTVFTAALIFVVLRLVLKRQAAATALGALVIFVWWGGFLGAPVMWLEILAEAAIAALFTLVMIRFGLLAALVAYFVYMVCPVVPLTLDVTHWSATPSNQTLAALVAMALFGFYASRAGQPLFGRWE